MERMEFTDEYRLGLADIDAQHEQLFVLFNSLIEVEERNASHDEICLVVDELVEYIDIHFKHEEQMLADCGFEGLAEHRNIHNGFVRKIIAFDKSLRRHESDLTWDILMFLSQWLVQHIMVEDRQYLGAMETSRS